MQTDIDKMGTLIEFCGHESSLMVPHCANHSQPDGLQNQRNTYRRNTYGQEVQFQPIT
jgi:hypothetical protein